MRTDEQIKRDVEDELRSDPRIDVTDVAVTVKDGVVALTGFAKSYLEYLDIEAAAKRVTGVTAVANDYGFDRVFVRQLEALGRQGDVAVAISTSGASANVVAGLQYARSRGLKTVAFTGGSGGPVGAAADVHVNVPHDVTPRVQELHRTLIHAVCDVIEQQIDRHG